jgi:hypothetical protein
VGIDTANTPRSFRGYSARPHRAELAGNTVLTEFAADFFHFRKAVGYVGKPFFVNLFIHIVNAFMNRNRFY